MTVAVDPISVVAEPVLLSASVTDVPVTVDVHSTAPVTVDVSSPVLAAIVVEQPVAVSLAVGGARGPAGPPGSGATVELTTSYALSGHRAITVNDAGQAIYADASDLSHLHRPVWLTTGAWDTGVTATLTAGGAVTEPTWAWAPGLPLWLGLGGAITQTIDPAAVFVRQVAEVITPTTVDFRPEQPIVTS